MYTILGIKILTTGETTSGTLVMHLTSASPRGGGHRGDAEEYGDFMGTLQQISALLVGEMWGL